MVLAPILASAEKYSNNFRRHCPQNELGGHGGLLERFEHILDELSTERYSYFSMAKCRRNTTLFVYGITNDPV